MCSRPLRIALLLSDDVCCEQMKKMKDFVASMKTKHEAELLKANSDS